MLVGALLFNLSYPSILINFTSPPSSSILLQRIGNDISRPLRVKTFFLQRIIARKFRLPLRCQSRLERDFFVSQFLAFSSSGDPIFQTRIRELKAGTVGHFSRSVPLAIASLSFSLDRGEIARIVVDQIFLSSRFVGQTQLCVSRVHSVKGKLVTIVTNGEAGKVLSRFTRFLGRR